MRAPWWRPVPVEGPAYDRDARQRLEPPRWRPFARWAFRRRWRAAMAMPADIPRRIAASVARISADLGLVVAGDCSARELVLGDRLLPMIHTWQDVEPTEQAITAAAEGMLRAIEAEHGPGRVWTFPQLEVVHLVYDDGTLVMLDRRNRPCVRLRAAYHHEAWSRPCSA